MGVIPFLGIEIDTIVNQLRLPREKLVRLQGTLLSWIHADRSQTPKSSVTKRDLLFLIVLLYHTSGVVKPGRTLIHGLVNVSMPVRSLEHYVSLRADTRADIAWWNSLISSILPLYLMLPVLGVVGYYATVVGSN